jgi:hypothetical protein
MKSKFSLVLCVLSVLAITGCAGQVGVPGLAVTGQVATGGKIIDAGVSLGSNSVTIGGLFSQGSNSYSGTVTAPVK